MDYRYTVNTYCGGVYCGNAFCHTVDECIAYAKKNGADFGCVDKAIIADHETGKKQRVKFDDYGNIVK